jgi:Tol biopolymer transport system component
MRLSLIALPLAAVSLACDGRPLPGPEAPGALQAVVEGSPGDFGEWGIPVHLGLAINTTFTESAPALAKNGLSLYFHSNRNGTLDLWVSRRSSDEESWQPPVRLPEPINSPFSEAAPTLSRDGHLMFFSSTRANQDFLISSFDLYVSHRENTHDDFAWEPPVPITELNSPFIDAGATYFENEGGRPQLYFNQGFDIYVSELQEDGTWGPPSPVAELNSPADDARPTIRHDGREIIFHSVRAGNVDLYVSRRNSTSDAWTTPVSLGPTVNSPSADQQSTLSTDGTALYFGSGRPGGLGPALDLWVTTRSKRGQHK